MSRTHHSWPTLKHPDGQLFDAIYNLDPERIGQALRAGADINCQLKRVDTDTLTPLSEALNLLPYSEAAQMGTSIALAIRLGYVTSDKYKQQQRSVVALLAAHGADFLTRNALVMLPVDAALGYVNDSDNAPAMAEAVLHTERALQAKGQTYRPDLTGIFMQIGGWAKDPNSQWERCKSMSAISDVAQLITQRLTDPEDTLGQQVNAAMGPETRRFWQDLAKNPPHPSTLPHPSAAFIALSENAEKSQSTVLQRYMNKATPERLAAAITAVKSAQTQHRRDWLSHQYKMELG